MPKKSSDSRLVYSTDGGRIKPEKPQKSSPTGDGIIRIRRETKGRKGKGVTTITGIPLQGEELKQLAKQLKQQCATGGGIKEGTVEIQGDHRETLKAALEKLGYTVKLAGG